MEGHSSNKSSPLSRAHSSLLRSSPTIRTSIHSLTEIDQLVSSDNDDDEHQKKERTNRIKSSNGPASAAMLFLLSSFAFSSLLFFFFFFVVFYFYLKRSEFSPSENLLLALVFIAIALLLAGRNKSRINRSIAVCRKSCNRFFFFLPFRRRGRGKPIQFAIGDVEELGVNKSPQDIGVEFFSNGDCYEGEFHKGKCNGSGVYNYYVKGRYEGDWVDGKYDGYGVEGWARGSRYKGQYRHGLRHGFGVYTFFTGDFYSGEWVNGQSYRVGHQTCSDGSRSPA